MDSKVALIRQSQARERIIESASSLAQHFELAEQVAALKNATHRDAAVEAVRQWEATADLLDALVVKVNATVPANPRLSEQTMSTEMPSAPVPPFIPTSDTGAQRKGSKR